MNHKPPRLDLNPSSADRWTTCTASPHFILENWDKVPTSSDTRYNREGTTAHEVAAAFLQDREPDPAECPVPVDADMLSHGWFYADYVRGLMKPGGRMIVEQKLPLWYMPERNAKVDVVIINPDSLHVIDYKYGEGVPVSPVENKQVVIYAKVAATGTEFMDNFPVFSHIYQPRGRAGETGPAHVWETTWGEVNEIARGIQYKAELIQGKLTGSLVTASGYLEFAPSEKACQWCPAKGFCTARQASLAEGFEVIDELQPLPSPGPAVLSEEQLVRILKHKAQMVKWLDDVEQWAEDFLKSGGKIPGYKLVQSRGGNRVWSDPEQAFHLLLAQTVLLPPEIIEQKILGPGAIEKLLGKNKFSVELTNLITKAPGVPVMAPEEDKRPALTGVVDEFETLEDGK